MANDNRGKLYNSQRNQNIDDSYELRKIEIDNITSYELVSINRIDKIRKALQEQYHLKKKDALKQAEKIESEALKKRTADMTLAERQIAAEKRKLSAEHYAEELRLQKEINKQQIADTNELLVANKKVNAELRKLKKQEANADKELEKIRRAEEAVLSRKEKAEKAKEEKKKQKERLDQLKRDLKVELELHKDNEKKKQEIQERYLKEISEADEAYRDASDRAKSYQSINLRGDVPLGDTGLSFNLGKLFDKYFGEVESQMSAFYKYRGSIMARMQGSYNSSYDSMLSRITGNLGLSPWAKQTDVIENMNKLIQEGVGYNVEQRAFLMTVSDKIATTFDAANGTLLRLIRMQQTDLTMNRLGLEASLTKLFNNMFSDTSYLSTAFDNVSAALMETNALLSINESTAFEYQVQKWLGSLVSVGFSDTGAQVIANAINLLGSGNVTSMSDIETRLLAMSASRAGLSFADLLTSGLTGETTNQLLASMVTYLKEISETNNNVIRAEYAKLFGMNVSDLASLRNLSAGDIQTLLGKSLNAGQATTEAQLQLFQIPLRTSMAEIINNVFENFTATSAAGIANNPLAYMMWLLSDYIGDNADIPIPFVSAAGFGLDVNASVSDLLKAGAIGTGLLTSLPQVLMALSGVGLGGLNPVLWGTRDFIPRGSGFTGLVQGFTSTTSQSAYIGTGSGSDIYESSVAAESDKGERISQITGAEENVPEKNTDDIYQLLSEKLASEAATQVILQSIDPAAVSQLKEMFSATASLLVPTGNNTITSNTTVPVTEPIESAEEPTYTLNDLIDRIMDGEVRVIIADTENTAALATLNPNKFKF